MMITKAGSTAGSALVGAALLGVLLAGSAAAQEPLGRPATPDTIRMDAPFDELQAQLERLLPTMRRLALTLQDALPGPEAEGTDRGIEAIARRAARFTRAYFDALVTEGFTREEALRIVSGVDVRSVRAPPP